MKYACDSRRQIRHATELGWTLPEAPDGIWLPFQQQQQQNLCTFDNPSREPQQTELSTARQEPHFEGHNTLQGKCPPVLKKKKCPKRKCPGPMSMHFVNQPDAFSKMWSNYQDSTYRNSSEPVTPPQQHRFPAPHVQSNALLHTGETLLCLPACLVFLFSKEGLS